MPDPPVTIVESALVDSPPVLTRSMPILFGVALVLTFLYLAKVVVIPVALAILVTFLLAPLVNLLQRRGLPRVPAVVLVTLLALGAVGGAAYAVTHQISSLLDSYPRYEQNINAKIDGLRARGRDGMIDKMQVVAQRITTQLERPGATPEPVVDAEIKNAQPVRIIDDDDPFRLSQLWTVAGPLLSPLANFGLVLVLVIFMLIKREDLRDRVISLIGQAQLADTTRAFEDAGERISRYLLMQLLINVGYGVAVMLGLWAIGVPYAPLWGFFAALLRYIPYLGPWLAAMLPIALSLLISRDWSTALLVIGLFGVLELITNMLIEPTLYGRGIGVSQAALLVAVAFWTWLWGPVGLVLASPLTVCLVVLGKHVPFLKFLDTLLGDRPALSPPYRFYQRLLAKDEDEAAELAEEQLGETSLVQVYDEVIVPTLALARHDVRNAKLDAAAQQELATASREIVEGLGRQARNGDSDDKSDGSDDAEASVQTLTRLLAVPARDSSDEVAVAMLRELIDTQRYVWSAASAASMASDVIALIEREAPAILCIASVPPGGLAHTKYLCKRVRARFPQLRIIVGRYSLLPEGVAKNREQLSAAGADHVSTTLAETLVQLQQLSTLDSPVPL
ncbi:MAG: AI-2E family transporter [Lysobacter sp.]|nr:AI-2E family transporter [Lysobacter sp.]